MMNTKSDNLLLAKLGLVCVVIVDLMGQGLLFPIINTLMMEPSVDFLPANTPIATRQFNYGLVLGVYFFSLFLGSVYISRLSDSIGRKKGLLICLSGSLLGYVLTIPALVFHSIGLLLLGRVITGFTAGNQPIAQAAMIDFSRDDAEKNRNLAFLVTGLNLGLIIGPLIGGILSSPTLLGSFASLKLPIYVAISLILITMGMISLFFRDAQTEKVPLRIRPQEVFLLLWQVIERPTVMRISLVFLGYMLTMNTFYIFMDNYLADQFQLSTSGTSLAMLVFGASLAFSSGYLAPIGSRYLAPKSIIVSALIGMGGSVVFFILTPSIIVTFLAIVCLGITFSFAYPTLLGIFSASVDATEQGWVMGVTTAIITLDSAIISLVGGKLMGQGIRYPFFVALCSAIMAILFIGILWQSPTMLRITQKPAN